MRQYLQALKDILDNGIDRDNRTGIPSRALFGYQIRFDLQKGFPAVTTKKLYFEAVVKELLWFISGSTNVRELESQGVKIWSADYQRWQSEGRTRFDGDLGPVYGSQWRHWKNSDGEEFDQLAIAIDKIKNNPNDRRIIVSAWNPGELHKMALPPCHAFFQFFVTGDDLSLIMYQRSCDTFLGVPFNIASYALLLHMVAQVTGKNVKEFIHVLGDAHIYHNHFEQVREQLNREPLTLPKLWINPDIKAIDDFTLQDIALIDYNHHSPIKADLNVGFPSLEKHK